MGNVREEYDEDKHFVNWVNMDLYEGYFVAVRPSENDIEHLVWIARALLNPISNPNEPSCIPIQYFRPISYNKNVQKFV